MLRRVVVMAALLSCFAVPAMAKIVDIKVTSGKVAFVVENSTSHTLVCDGKLTGKTKSGKYVDAKMKKESVRAGAYLELSVIAFEPDKDPFVDGWSDISCTADLNED